MTFQFCDGDVVASTVSIGLHLPPGSRGVVFCRYETEPPAYEVNFEKADGMEWGAVVYEHELTTWKNVPQSQTLAASAR